MGTYKNASALRKKNENLRPHSILPTYPEPDCIVIASDDGNPPTIPADSPAFPKSVARPNPINASAYVKSSTLQVFHRTSGGKRRTPFFPSKSSLTGGSQSAALLPAVAAPVIVIKSAPSPHLSPSLPPLVESVLSSLPALRMFISATRTRRKSLFSRGSRCRGWPGSGKKGPLLTLW